MKYVTKNKVKKKKVNNKIIDKSKKAQVLVVAQEFRLARLLSGNEKKTRDKVLKTLKKWLSSCFHKGYDFKEDDFLRVWKGLFYAVWMSDKPLIQEELCENIASLLDQFPSDQIKSAMLMTKAGFKVLATEWYGIDHHRMDKFLMLVRRYLRGSLRCLSRCKWSVESCKLYAKMLSCSDGLFALKTPHYARNATSMLLHIIDCFLEELAKVSNAELPEDSLVEIFRPFCTYMCSGETPTLCVAARRLLTELMRQSDQGLEYQEAKKAWEMMGCPEGGPEALELVVEDDEETPQEKGDHGPDGSDEELSEEKALDPRAGRVDVLLPTLPVPAAKLAAVLRDLLANASSRAHKRVRICLERFEKLSQQEYPLRLEVADRNDDEPMAVSKAKAAKELHALEKTLVSSSDELALRGLSRKHRKRLLAKTRAGLSIVEDVEKLHQTLKNTSVNGEWQIDTAEPKPKKAKKEDTSNKENHREKVKKPKLNIKIKNDQNNSSDSKKKSVSPKNSLKEQKSSLVRTKNLKEEVRKDKNHSFKSQESKEKSLKPTLNGNVDKNSSRKVNELKSKNIQTVGKDKEIKTVKDVNSIVNKKIDLVKNAKKAKAETEKSKKLTLPVNKVKKFQKPMSLNEKKSAVDNLNTPKKVKFVLKNNSMQRTVDYYKSVKLSPNIPFDGEKKPVKTNLKPSTPSPINPFFKKKLKLKF